MAFGKDPSVLSRLSGQQGSMPLGQRMRARQQAASDSRPRSGGGGGAYASRFDDRFVPTLEEEPDTIRIIAGEYKVKVGKKRKKDNGEEEYYLEEQVLEYFPRREHFDSRANQGIICSAGPFYWDRKHRETCLGCEAYFAKKDSPVSRRFYDTWTVLHIKPHHKMESTDRKGGIRTDRSGNPFYIWVPCQGRGCDGCRMGKDTIPAHLKHWSLGNEQSKFLLGKNDLIEKSCASCNGRDTIRSISYTCRNPECRHDIIDMETTTYKSQDIRTLTSKEMRCPACGTEDFPEEFIKCSKCSSPVRACFFDVNLSVRLVEVAQTGRDGQGSRKNLDISYWSDPGPLPAELLKYAKPLDLARTFKPTPVEEQTRKLDLTWLQRAPAQGAPNPAQMSRPYGEQSAQLPPDAHGGEGDLAADDIPF